jgi:hypothetical protein
MIRKSGGRFSDKIMRHDPEKWRPVFPKNCVPPKNFYGRNTILPMTLRSAMALSALAVSANG